MKRATLTVILKGKDCCGFDASMLMCNFDETVTFVSSGVVHTISADSIEKITYGRATWCGQCDQPIEQFSRG